MDPLSPIPSSTFSYPALPPITEGQPTASAIAPAVSGGLPAADQVILSDASVYSALGAGTYTPAAGAPLPTGDVSVGDQLALASAASDAQTIASLFGGMTSTSSTVSGMLDPAAWLIDASTSYGLLNTLGASALNYASPAAPPSGNNVNALA